MTINGLRYAIVKDTIKNVNIIVPKCNCRLTGRRKKKESAMILTAMLNYMCLERLYHSGN